MSSTDVTEVESVNLSTTMTGSIELSELEQQTQDAIDHEEKGQLDVTLDRTLPLNWSTRKKFFNMAVPSILCFVT
jgi:hypothetical protein